MGLDYHFYVEQRRAGQWRVPPAFLTKGRPGQVLGFSQRSAAVPFFFGADAWFPFVPELPPDWLGSELRQGLTHYDFAVNEYNFVWQPFAGLRVEEWRAVEHLWSAGVPARLAGLFGAGESSFPEAELQDRGVEEWRMDDIRQGGAAREPINRLWGAGANELAHAPADRRLQVTWRGTLEDYLDPQFCAPLLKLRELAPDDDLRIVASLS